MTNAVKNILTSTVSLTPDEKSELLRALIEALDSQDDGTSPEWETEINRRVIEVQNGGVIGKPAEQLHMELRARKD